MRLISAHIENFGTLHDLDFNFESGLNTIFWNNGKGKSTLASFIKVMFYGFDNEKKRKEYENERDRFTPWQGGIYGGRIKFEVEGKTYTVARTFGETKKMDTYTLLDDETNQESQKYSSEIGQELFGLDAESFKRTVFIAQNSCTTTATDSINAKLGDMTELTGDMGQYESAGKILNNALNRLNPNRKTGSIYILKNEISRLKIELQESESVDDKLLYESEKLKQLTHRLTELEEKQQGLQKKQDQAEVTNELIRQHRQYEEIKKRYDERKKEYDRARAPFPGDPPIEAELEKMERMQKGMEKKKLKLAEQKSNIKYDEAEYNRLKNRNIPDASEIEKMKNLMNKYDDLVISINNDKSMLPETKSVNNYLFCFLIIFIVLFCIIEIHESIFDIPGLFFIILGIVTIIGSCIFMYIKEVNTTAKYADLCAKINKKEYKLKEMGDELRDFASANNLSQDMDELWHQLYTLTIDERMYCQLTEMHQIYEENSAMIDESRKELNDYVIKYGSKTIDQVRKKYDRYKPATTELKRVLKEKEKFEFRKDFSRIMSVNSEEWTDTGALIVQLRNINKEINQINESIRSSSNRRDNLQAKQDEFDDKSMELKIKEKNLSIQEKDYRLFNITRELLDTAKFNITARYMTSLLSGFKKYYSMMNGERVEDFAIDTKINLSINVSGQYHVSQLLSQGMQDLTGICQRMAMVDAMYPNEKPFIIMDDPFCNLDSEHLHGGLVLLHEIAKEYQIIYFTCHESRKYQPLWSAWKR